MALETASGKKAGITRQKYYDPIRGEQLGYAFDGRVFEDEALSKRIPVGSVVPTLGGTFLLTDQEAFDWIKSAQIQQIWRLRLCRRGVT